MAKKSVMDDEPETKAPPERHEPPHAHGHAEPEAPAPATAPEPLNAPAQLAAPTQAAAPTAFPATHFRGPVVVGPSDMPGEVPQLRRLLLDNTNVTDFAVKFPIGSVLWRVILRVITAYNGTTPKVTVGSTTGGTSDIINATIPGPGLTDTLVSAPLSTSGTNAYTAYLGVTGASTAGAAEVLFLYAGRPAAKLS